MATVQIFFQPHKNKLDSQGKPTGDVVPEQPVYLGQIVFGTGKNNYVKVEHIQLDEGAIAYAMQRVWSPADREMLTGRLLQGSREYVAYSGIKARLMEEVNSIDLSTGDPKVAAIEFVRRMLEQTRDFRFKVDDQPEGKPIAQPQSEGTDSKEPEEQPEDQTTHTSQRP